MELIKNNIKVRALGSSVAVFALTVIIGILFINRYISIGVDSDQVYLFGIYYFFATSVFMFSRLLYNSLLNPLSIFTVFLYLLSYSFIRLSDVQRPYSNTTFLVINLSIFFYILFSSFNLPSQAVKIAVLNIKLKRSLIYTICVLAFFTFLAECAVFGYVPILNVGGIDVYNETNQKLIPFLHYFITLLGFMPTWLYLYFKEKLISKKEFIFLMLLTAFILLNYLSKQTYLMVILSFFIAYSNYNKVNVKLLIRGFLVVVFMLVSTAYLRFDSNSEVPFAEYFRAVAGIENDEVTAVEATFVEYSSKRFTVLNDMVEYSDKTGYYGMGSYTFRPFLSLFLVEKIGIVKRKPELDSEEKVATYMADPYIDFGIIGVIILSSFYGLIARRYYNQFRERKIEAIIKFSIIIFCVFMGMFINFYNTMFIWMGFIFNKLLLGELKSIYNK